MKYVVHESVRHQHATPRGIVEASFDAGEVEVDDDSDERFILETVLVPEGLAERAVTVPAAQVAKPKARPKQKPKSAPDAPESPEGEE